MRSNPWVWLCLSVFSLGLSVPASGQKKPCSYTISGKVLDAHDHSPLTFAEVYIVENKRGTVVDSLGHYNLSGLCPGSYTVVASHVGCAPVVRNISLKGNVHDFDFYPEHHEEMLAEAEIVAEKTRQTAEAKVELNTKELESVRGKSLAESMELISGVRSLKTGNSVAKPIIHGLYGNRVIILNNGIRQEDQQWGMEHAPNIDPFSAENISVIKGVGAVQYGSGAVGGVVKLDAGPLPFLQDFQGKLYLIGQSNGRGGSAALQVSQGLDSNWAYRLQLSGKKLGDFSAPKYILTNTGTSELNGSVEVGYRKNDLKMDLLYSHFSSVLGILRSSHIGNTTDFLNAVQSNEPYIVEPFSYKINNPQQELSHDLAKLEADYKLSSRNLLNVRYGVQADHRKEYDIRRGGRDSIPANSLKLITHTLDVSVKSFQSSNLTGTCGVSGLVQINSNAPGTGIRPILPNYNKYVAGAFAMEKLELQKWILEAGMRYDYQYTFAQKYDRMQNLDQYAFNYNNYSASGGATYKFGKHWQLSTMLGYAYRAPSVNELLSEGLHHGAATIEEGDTSLLAEKSLNWSSTLSVNYVNKVKLELTAYANPIDGYIYLKPQQEPRLTVRGAFPVSDYTQTNALLTGIDLDGQIFLSPRWSYTFNGSLIRGLDRTANDYLVLIPPDQFTHGIKWQAGDFKSFKNPFIELKQQLVSRQHRIPENGELLNINPPGGYQLFNFSMGTDFKVMKKLVSVTFSIENLMNKSYRDYLNRQRFYADEMGRNFLIKIKRN